MIETVDDIILNSKQSIDTKESHLKILLDLIEKLIQAGYDKQASQGLELLKTIMDQGKSSDCTNRRLF
jgi:hypothetical protein